MKKMKKIQSFLAALMMTAALPVVPAIEVAAVNAPDPLDGCYVIRNVNSQKSLNVEGGSTVSGTNVQQWSTNAAHTYDTWRIESAADGFYKIYSMLEGGTSLVLSSGTADNNVTIASDAGTDNQLYGFYANKDGSFRIISKADEKAVEVINASTDSGANVQMWETNGVNCQDWELIPVTWTTVGEETKCTVNGDDFLPGDLNDDGVVNIFDVALAKNMLIKSTGTQHQKYAANVDGNAGVTVTDLVALAKWVLLGQGEFIAEEVPMERIYAAVDGKFEKGYVETEHTGFTQSAYLNLFNEVGSDVTLNVEVPAAGIYALTVNFASGGTAARGVSVLTNRQIGYYTLTGEATGSWDTWNTETIYVELQKGLNTVTFTSLTADGAPNIDSITIATTDQAESPKTPIDPVKGVPVGGANNNRGEGYQMEYLTRGLVAANTGSGMLLTWRILATDDDNTSYKLYKNGTLLAEIAAGSASNYLDAGGSPTDKYTIDTYSGNTCIDKGSPATVFGTKNTGTGGSGAYFDIPTNTPAGGTSPDGVAYTYTENDCSVGDVDGDGVYEIFVKWDPSNSHDNANNGYSGNVIIDCYRLDGTQLWRIDLGKNIRAGAHYTQFMVYDFDGDGKCEMICKTADGTKDGKGTVIGDGSKDWRNDAGRPLSGPEYITLFDGLTGAALDTQDYEPGRGTVADWGDTYGNRCDRMTACVAYLDGQNASAVFGRGYYTRMCIAAWDVVNKKLSKRWVFDTGYTASTPGYGDGNHHILGADCDGDGKQEIVTGSAVVDDNGKLLYTTSNAHGDAVHIGDFVPSNPGLEIFQCLEDEKHPNGKTINFGVILRDAKTGKELFRETAGGDTGRCIADNLIAGNAGAEMAGSHNAVLYDCVTGKQMVDASGNGMTFNSITKWGQNSLVYWTDVLERAVLDRTMADQYGKGRVFTGDGVTYNNASKSNACLTCDLMGDWREEMIFRKSDGGLRVFTTTFQTEYPIYSLMHNPQYRVQVAAQNNGYNQPPHVDYFLGTGYDLPTKPTVFDYTAN